jgi:hypothetical protein
MILAAGAVLALSACGSNDEANQTDLSVNNLVVEDLSNGSDTMMMNGGDMNAMDMNSMNGAETANAVATDMNTNDPDTNLANGM